MKKVCVITRLSMGCLEMLYCILIMGEHCQSLAKFDISDRICDGASFWDVNSKNPGRRLLASK